jgi:hypothetical protein
MAMLVSRDFAAEVGGRKNSQSGPPDFVPPNMERTSRVS